MAQVTLSEYRDQVAAIIQAGQFDHALRAIRFLLFHYPQYVEGYRLLGQCLLEAGHQREAALQFLRVLSADPECVVARTGLARAYQLCGEVPQALAQMQLACDLAPNDPALRQQLQQLMLKLYGEALQPEMTLAGLGRIYAYNGLYAKAIQEFRAVLVEDPRRADVQVALAEMLWRECRYFEAAEVCQDILSKLPNVLKVNLILSVILLDSDHPDGARPYLKTAQTLDPENTLAQVLLGDQSPLAPREVRIQWPDEADLSSKLVSMSLMPTDSRQPMCLEPVTDWANEWYRKETAPMSDAHQPDDELDIPDWLKGVGDDLLAEESEPAERASASVTLPTEETPGWLRDLQVSAEAATTEAAPGPGVLPAASDSVSLPSTEALEGPPASAAAPSEPERMPDWLAEILAAEPAAEKPTSPAQGLTEEAAPQPAEAEVDFETWLSQLTQVEVAPEAGAGAPSGELGQASTPDWASLPTAALPVEPGESPEWLRPEAVREPTEQPQAATFPETELAAAAPVGDEESEMPDWLRQIVEGTPPPLAEASAEEELFASAADLPEAELDESSLPEWLRDFQPEPPAAPPTRGQPQVELPSWLQSLDTDEVATAPLASVEEVAPAAAEVSAEPGDLPDWLREIVIGEAVPPAAPEAATGQPAAPVSEAAVEPEELPAGAAAVPEDRPDWLQPIVAGEAEVVVSAPAEPEAELVAGPVEEVAQAEAFPDWLQRLAAAEPAAATTEIEELPVAEESLAGAPAEALAESELPPGLPSVPEVAPAVAETIEPEAAEVPAWLRELQEVAEAGEEVTLPEPTLPEWVTPSPPVEAEAPEAAPSQEPISIPILAEEVMRPPEPPVVEVVSPGPPEMPEVSPAVSAEIESPVAAVAEVVAPAEVQQVPEAIDERLAAARAALTCGNWSEALAAYAVLVNSGELLDHVIADLEEGTRQHPKDVAGFQLLGDACMKSGRLSAALRAYRTALANLY